MLWLVVAAFKINFRYLSIPPYVISLLMYHPTLTVNLYHFVAQFCEAFLAAASFHCITALFNENAQPQPGGAQQQLCNPAMLSWKVISKPQSSVPQSQ